MIKELVILRLESLRDLIETFGVQILNLNPWCFQSAGTQTTWIYKFPVTNVIYQLNCWEASASLSSFQLILVGNTTSWKYY